MPRGLGTLSTMTYTTTPINALSGRYDGYQLQELPNGDLVIYRHDFSVVGTASSWRGAVELMEGDG